MSWIDAFSPGWSDALGTAEQGNSFLLVDGAFDPDWSRWLATSFPDGCGWKPIFPAASSDERVLEVSPLLIDLRTVRPHKRLYDRLATGLPVLSLVNTTECLEELLARLAPWRIAHVGEQSFNFRFCDTRRLPAIVSALVPEQHGQLFGPAMSWRYIDRQGKWDVLPLPERPLAPCLQVKLAEAQFSALLADSEPDEYLALIADEEGGLPNVMRPSERFHRVKKALRQATMDREFSVAGRLAKCRAALGIGGL